jgi:hypothetical protein
MKMTTFMSYQYQVVDAFAGDLLTFGRRQTVDVTLPSVSTPISTSTY